MHAERRTPAPAGSVRACALVVENGESGAELVRHLLRRAGLERCAQVVNGFHEAVNHLAHSAVANAPPLSLVVVSQELGSLGGLALLSALRGRPDGAPTKVVILAHARDTSVESACIADPNASYLLRPADHERLGDLLAGLIASQAGVRPPA